MINIHSVRSTQESVSYNGYVLNPDVTISRMENIYTFAPDFTPDVTLEAAPAPTAESAPVTSE